MINLNDIRNNYPTPKLDDIQGIILRGYTFPYIRYIIFTITDKAGAQAFLSNILPGASDIEVTTAKPWEIGKRPEYSLTVGLTYSGMRELMKEEDREEVENRSSNVFSLFMEGAVGDAIAVGDVGASAPKNWWEKSGEWKLEKPASDYNDKLHILASIYADSEENREIYHQKLLAQIPPENGSPALREAYLLDSNPLKAGDDYIHFGYKDSLSQPRLSNVPWNTTQGRLLLGKSTVDDRPLVPPYHFVITPKFKKDPSDPASPMLPKYKAHPLLYNGSFAAFRVLHQDVKAFKKFIDKPRGGNITPELIAAKMCGRWYDGTPLTVSPDHPLGDKLDGFDFTNFNYMSRTAHQHGDVQSDDFGQVCPYAAHIRRTNPRDDWKVQGNTNNAEEKRLMRRAGPYGIDYNPEKPDDGIPRGLVGLFICANLSAQFSFIMETWVTNGGFRNGGENSDISPNKSGVDPVFGIDDGMAGHQNFAFLPPGSPAEPKTEDYTILGGLPQFIRTDGGLYVFLPGIEGLRHLANGTIPKTLNT